ncbi:glycosyltransferase family 25 protein [Roseovarius aestuarii]|nr:glycosyltransferase family 25 protein [Roseovarius aestuarii]
MHENDQNTTELLVLIITCRKSPPARVLSARAELEALNLPIEIEVLDGYVSEDDCIDAIYDAKTNRRRVKRPISRSEIAVYATHRMAWKRLTESGHPAAIVFEDDFAVRKPKIVEASIQFWREFLGDGRDMVKLFDFEKRKRNNAVCSARVREVDLVKWSAPSAGMVAYLISHDGAQKFLSRKRIFRQVDEDAKYFWELGLNIWSIPDNPVAEISNALGGSLVEADRQSHRERRFLRSLWGNLLVLDRKLRTWIYLRVARH